MTAYNAYRVQKVLNYDSNSQKGFVTERSKEEYSRCVREMKACMKEIDAQFDAAARSYRERCGEVRSLDFWEKVSEPGQVILPGLSPGFPWKGILHLWPKKRQIRLFLPLRALLLPP